MFYMRDKRMTEGPVAALGGALLGGLIGGGGTMAGLLTAGGMMGAALGGVAGTILGGSMMPGLEMPSQPSQQQVNRNTPGLPGAPGVPGAPGSTPGGAPGGSPPTADEIMRGEMERKRRGRVSTILSNPESRGEFLTGDTEQLGGSTF